MKKTVAVLLSVVALAGLSVLNAQESDPVKFTGIKEIQINKGTDPLTATVLVELTNTMDKEIVIKEALFRIKFEKPTFEAVQLEAAEPADEVVIAPGGKVKTSRGVAKVLVNIGAVSEGAAERVYDLFNMVCDRTPPGDLKVTLDGKIKVGARGKGESVTFAEREVRFILIPEAAKTEAVLR
jgi:hypothetical protein